MAIQDQTIYNNKFSLFFYFFLMETYKFFNEVLVWSILLYYFVYVYLFSFFFFKLLFLVLLCNNLTLYLFTLRILCCSFLKMNVFYAYFSFSLSIFRWFSNFFFKNYYVMKYYILNLNISSAILFFSPPHTYLKMKPK